MIAILLIVAGIVLLYWGGEMLVDNAIRVARALGVSPLVIGLTVVSFATSAPELAASLTAALSGATDIALGNAFGSNIANVGLILGLTVLAYRLPATIAFIRREVAAMVVFTALMYPLMMSGTLGRAQGALLLVMLAAFLIFLLRNPEEHPLEDEHQQDETSTGRSLLGVLLGLALLVAGARVLITGAVDTARLFDISERIIGLTLVALGTSLPELAASLAAARKGEADLVLGNIVGSNVFNLLCILGITAIVHPIPVSPQAMGLDFFVMLGLSLALLVFLLARRRLFRAEGVLLLAAYVAYIVFLYQ